MSGQATSLPVLRPRSAAHARAAAIPGRMLSRLEIAFCFLGLALSANAVLPLILNPAIGVDPSIKAHDPYSRVLWLVVIAGVLAGLVHDGRRVLAAVVRNGPLVALCGLALLSALWSPAPRTTLIDGVLLLVTTVFGFYLGVRFTMREVITMVAWLGLLIAVASIVFALALPRYGLDIAHPSDWRGVFTTKNELGRLMVISGVAWTSLLLTGEAPRRWWAPVAVILFVGIESGSRTALTVAGLMAVVWSLVWIFQRRGRRWMPVKGLAISACLLITGIALVSQPFLLRLVGADSSFTGRTGIWNAVVDDIGVHPWLGWGFDGFWLGIDSRAVDVLRAVGFMPPHAHDGYLDLLLGLGIVGTGLFVLAIAVIARGAWRSLRTRTGATRMFPLVYLLLFLLYNVSESSLVSKQSLAWILLCAVAAAVAVPEVRRAGRAAT